MTVDEFNEWCVARAWQRFYELKAVEAAFRKRNPELFEENEPRARVACLMAIWDCAREAEGALNAGN